MSKGYLIPCKEILTSLGKECFTKAMTKSDLIKKLGSATALARAAKCSKQAVGQWPEEPIPAERVLHIVRSTDGDVTPHELNPVMYPDPSWLPPGVPSLALKDGAEGQCSGEASG